MAKRQRRSNRGEGSVSLGEGSWRHRCRRRQQKRGDVGVIEVRGVGVSEKGVGVTELWHGKEGDKGVIEVRGVGVWEMGVGVTESQHGKEGDERVIEVRGV
jgi:hypothetical protein